MAVDPLDEGKRAFAAQAWNRAFERLSLADRRSPLRAADLEQLAEAAFLTGREADCDSGWSRAYQAHLDDGNGVGAARSAYWAAFHLVNRGELARAAGWAGRATRSLDESGVDCVERGHVLMLEAIQTLWRGDAESAQRISTAASDIAARFEDADLTTLTNLGRGQALILQGRRREGLALLDDAMVAATTGEASATVAGLAYCAVISTCHETFDLRRAQEWTAALSQWCDAQPELVPYTGWCQIHRAEIMQIHGAWEDAADAARLAYERSSLSQDQATAGAARYILGDLHRLTGDLTVAEDEFRDATRHGRDVQPGLAMLRVAQGQHDHAAQSVRRIVDDEPASGAFRAATLAAAVEILLMVDDLPAARSAAEGLTTLAATYESELLDASAAGCRGAVLLAEHQAKEALTELRRAWRGWAALEAPYEAARARVLIGCSYRLLDDEDSAQMELDSARWTFLQLGATLDVAQVEALTHPLRPTGAAGLTAREVEVLRLVAAGKTNRAVATDLVLSEKTVARHLSNIYTKLGLPSRSAATSYAYEHHLV